MHPTRSIAIERAFAEPHQIDHHDRPLVLELPKTADIQQIDAHEMLLTGFDEFETL
jgi:hypothetical protein